MTIDPVTVPPASLGRWRVERFVVSDADAKFSALRAMIKGRGGLPAGVYTKLVCEGRGIVMSDTPDEKRDHSFAVYKARGHVLINGLGLGMVLGAILKKPEVDRVTVVEIDHDVVGLIGPHYASDKLEIMHADAFGYQPPTCIRYGAVWHDIWDTICADNIPQMTKLKRKYGRRADWQGCWAESQCRQGGR